MPANGTLRKKTTSSEPSVSIIILGYKQQRFLDACFSSLKKTKYKNYKVMYVDNARDGSVQWVKEHYPEILAVESPTNSGYAGGNNLGMRLAPAEYYVLHNPDMEHVDPFWLKKMVAVLEGDPKGGFAGGVIMPIHLREKLDTKKVRAILPAPIKVHMVSGSLMLVSHNVLEQVGYMCEDYFLYWEETDWQYRAQLQGFHVWYVNTPYLNETGTSTLLNEQSKSTLLHPRREVWVDELGNPKPQGFYLFYRNQIMVLLITAGTTQVLKGLWTVFLRTIYHGILKFHPRKVAAMGKAIGWLFSHRKQIAQERHSVQSKRVIPDSVIAERRAAKDAVSAKLDAYYKSVEAQLLKEKKPLKRIMFH